MPIEVVGVQEREVVLSDEAIVALKAARLPSTVIGPTETFEHFLNQPQLPEINPSKCPDDSYNVD